MAPLQFSQCKAIELGYMVKLIVPVVLQ